MNQHDQMILAVIPARGGSKGVPCKNIRPVLGKPLIAYAIECGLKCPSIDRLIVSTDNDEIANIARRFGADVPFMRPKELAEDTTPMLPVLQHAVQAAEGYYGRMVKALVLLDPTGPLRTMEDIEGSLRLLMDSACDAVISGNIAHRSPYFNMVIEQEGYIRLVIPGPELIGRRQDSPPVYDLNTVVWVYSRRALMEEKSRVPKRSLLYPIPSERAIDMDTELDFKILEFLMSQKISIPT